MERTSTLAAAGWRDHRRALLLALSALVVMVSAAGVLAGRTPVAGTKSVAIPPAPHSRQIAIAGHKLLVGYAGSGSPTVLIMTDPDWTGAY